MTNWDRLKQDLERIKKAHEALSRDTDNKYTDGVIGGLEFAIDKMEDYEKELEPIPANKKELKG